MSCLTRISLLTIVLLQSISAAKIENRVQGGEGFGPNKHGYLVKLFIFHKTFAESGFTCSGSIINSQWIISSAHCFPEDVNSARVYQQWSKDPIAYSNHFVLYPGYIQDAISYSTMEKDLALLKTISQLNFNYVTTWPIALPEGPVSLGSLATIAGYGVTEPGLSAPREGLVHISECEYSSGESVLCSYNAVRGDFGDSGGSLVYNDTLVGVTSGSMTFTVLGTVYTNVYNHMNWITSVIGKSY